MGKLGKNDKSRLDYDEMFYAPCVGCGYCCLSAPCQSNWVQNGRCVKLIWDKTKERYLCQKALEDKLFCEYMAIGAGCSSSLNTWRRDVRYRG